MERSKITDELLILVDSSPLNDVDIAPIISKYTNAEMHVDEAMQIRGIIVTALKDLKEDKEIDFNDSRLGELLSASGGVFKMSTFPIRSTRHRYKELEKAKEIQKPSIGTQNNVYSNSGSVQQGGQESRFEGLPQMIAPNAIPTNTQTTEYKKPSGISKVIADNIAKILIGIITGLVVAFLAWKFGWKK